MSTVSVAAGRINVCICMNMIQMLCLVCFHSCIRAAHFERILFFIIFPQIDSYSYLFACLAHQSRDRSEAARGTFLPEVQTRCAKSACFLLILDITMHFYICIFL